ncbi:MAG TPA: bifunctional 5,10-methylenetetrahydrofolate dehydrogenase/5,10-methenyltetrahydrofolate cyclohydrolase [Candidatus Moranbacteria bacterium]|nr:bifunctional 5,10-methylenetetrahydrofolate dehydrogenase/5,10-methenyltetrahydrofolate cyclohydrolase [Candidatus Moranbacteria bacterium]HRZ33949.1 bifunctional 5,10-methylenetetrahydrofolate dehydrogenase/5,10-methenyltetrahydrofolate cyclohydrolase [Candidatus Moranbacteria bacterium]
MILLYGKPIADKILNRLKSDISMSNKKPGMAVILVGKDEASHLYVSLKEKKAREIGINFQRFDLEENISENKVIDLIQKINNDKNIHGMIVQMPLPRILNAKKIISNIDPRKDADGFSGKSALSPVFPQAILLLLESSGENLERKKAIVIANSDEFGQTMAKMLLKNNIQTEYLIAKNMSENMNKIRKADIVISAVGHCGLLKGEMLKDKAIVIDGGIEKFNGKVIGDVDFASVEEKNGFLSPVPGGVGPVTIACLLENVYLAFKAQQKENN